MPTKNSEEVWGKVVARTWSDASFKELLLADPAKALKEYGIAFPQGVTVKVMEDSADVVHLILPPPPGELGFERLDKVAGGAFDTYLKLKY